MYEADVPVLLVRNRRHVMAAGTVVHSPRPGMQLRKRIAVAGRCVSNASSGCDLLSADTLSVLGVGGAGAKDCCDVC